MVEWILMFVCRSIADFNFSALPSSMIAAASIITSVNGQLTITKTQYLHQSLLSQVSYKLHEITGIEKVRTH